MKMEETVTTTENAAENAAAPATAAAEVGAEEGATENNTDASADGPKKNGVTKRIDELVKLREEARRDAEYWRKVALEKLEAEKGKGGKRDTQVDPGRPSPDGFKTYDEYVEALTDWKLEEKTRADAEARRADEEGRRLAERIARAEEKYPDFRSVALNPDVPITPAMYSALVDSDAGADIAYWLGKNPHEAGRIAALSPVAAVKEIGRLESRFSGQNAPRRVSQAPAPVRTISGSGGEAEKAPAEMSMEEYRAWRRAKG